jgi:hypothetical protein
MRSILVSVLVLQLGGAAVAQAEEPPPPPPEEAPPAGPVGERVVLPGKRLYARASIEINLSSGSAFDPFSIAPDVFYGVTPDFTVGLVHSSVAGTGFIGGVGSSLCFGGCDVYNGLGFDGRYHLKGGNLAVAGNFGLYVGALDPFQLAVKLGAVGRYRPSPSSKLAVDFAPSLFIGVTEREPAVMGAEGNKEVLVIPATVLYTAAPRIVAMVQTGLILPFASAGDLYSVPLSIGGSYQVNKQISVEAAFTLLALLGGELRATGFDGRSFTIGGGYAF